jgi:CubicO group peptidase (beta-lactamase class C family)
VAARGLERALVRIKGKLYGEAHLIHLTWTSLWAQARACLDEHNRIETEVVEALLRHGEPATIDGLARRIFDAETRGPTRPHPLTPHTGLLGSAARRMWALADRFWDDAEGRVIPAPVQPHARRHDSLIGQYLVADPKFDATASLLANRRRPLSGNA